MITSRRREILKGLLASSFLTSPTFAMFRRGGTSIDTTPPPPPPPAARVATELFTYDTAEWDKAGTNYLNFNATSGNLWRNPGGDWTDSTETIGPYVAGASQGTSAFLTISDSAPGALSGSLTTFVTNSIAAGKPLDLMMKATGNPTLSGRFGTNPPTLGIVYSDATTDTLTCLGAALIDPSSPTYVPPAGTELLTILPMSASAPVFLHFPHPDTAKTVSTATLNLTCTAASGAYTLKLFRVDIPLGTIVLNSSFPAGFMDTLPAARVDGLASLVTEDIGLGSQSGVLAFFDSGTAVSDTIVHEPLDTSEPIYFDWSGADSDKYPLKNYGKFTAYLTGELSVIDGTYTTAGYYPLSTNSTKAIMNTISGQADWYYFLKPTTTGDQSEAMVDGLNVPMRVTHNVTPQFSTTIDSPLVSVKDVGHGVSGAGEWVEFLFPVSVGGIMLLRWYKTTSVTNGDNYVIDISDNPVNAQPGYNFSIVSGVCTYNTGPPATGSANTTWVQAWPGQHIKISGSVNSALNGTFTLLTGPPFSAAFGVYTFNVSTGDASGADTGAMLVVVPNANVTDGGAVPVFSVSGSGEIYPLVTLADHAYPTADSALVNWGGSFSFGGLTIPAARSLYPASQTQNTFIAEGFSTGGGSFGTSTGAGSASMNGGNVSLGYASGNPIPAGVLPQELYVRWYELFGDDFVAPDFFPNMGGKHGFAHAHTLHNISGNGGAPAQTIGGTGNLAWGRAGWSKRNQWEIGNDPDGCEYGAITLGTYRYDIDFYQNGTNAGLVSLIPRGRWACIEVRQKMNTFDPTGVTPPATDGIIEIWVDGVLALSQNNVRWRINPPWWRFKPEQQVVVGDMGIQTIWNNTYYGGQPAPGTTVFTGSISGTTLTVTAMTSTTINGGDWTLNFGGLAIQPSTNPGITLTNVSAGTQILRQLTGATGLPASQDPSQLGWTGTYELNQSQTVGSTSFTYTFLAMPFIGTVFTKNICIATSYIGPMTIPYTGPGDSGATFYSWWGLRGFSTATKDTTQAIRIQRVSDNAQMDIGLINGDLDLDAVNTFTGGVSPYVVIAYDQTGNGNHLSSLWTGANGPWGTSWGTDLRNVPILLLPTDPLAAPEIAAQNKCSVLFDSTGGHGSGYARTFTLSLGTAVTQITGMSFAKSDPRFPFYNDGSLGIFWNWPEDFKIIYLPNHTEFWVPGGGPFYLRIATNSTPSPAGSCSTIGYCDAMVEDVFHCVIIAWNYATGAIVQSIDGTSTSVTDSPFTSGADNITSGGIIDTLGTASQGSLEGHKTEDGFMKAIASAPQMAYIANNTRAYWNI